MSAAPSDDADGSGVFSTGLMIGGFSPVLVIAVLAGGTAYLGLETDIGSGLPTWQLSGLLFYSAHMVEIAGGRVLRAVNERPDGYLLYVAPVIGLGVGALGTRLAVGIELGDVDAVDRYTALFGFVIGYVAISSFSVVLLGSVQSILPVSPGMISTMTHTALYASLVGGPIMLFPSIASLRARKT